MACALEVKSGVGVKRVCVRVGVEKVREGKGQGGGARGRNRAGAKDAAAADAPAAESAEACVYTRPSGPKRQRLSLSSWGLASTHPKARSHQTMGKQVKVE